jgi:hypothetical protein
MKFKYFGLGALLCFAAMLLMGAATDDWINLPMDLAAPADHAFLCTPSDSADLAHASRAVRCATGGNLKVTTRGGETLIIPTVVAGETLPLRVTRIWSTNTTANTAGDITVYW